MSNILELPESYKEVNNIVWIPTIPRSRSSMTAGIIKRCGGWCGNVTKGYAAGRGMYENGALNGSCFHLYIQDMGGSKPVSEIYKTGQLKNSPGWEYVFNVICNQQGWNGEDTVFFKQAPFMWFHREIKEKFPNSYWIVPRRSRDGRKQSMMRLWKTMTEEQIDSFNELYEFCLDDIINENEGRAWNLDTDELVNTRKFAYIENIVHKIPGLKWNDKDVKKWVGGRKDFYKPEETPVDLNNKKEVKE